MLPQQPGNKEGEGTYSAWDSCERWKRRDSSSLKTPVAALNSQGCLLTVPHFSQDKSVLHLSFWSLFSQPQMGKREYVFPCSHIFSVRSFPYRACICALQSFFPLSSSLCLSANGEKRRSIIFLPSSSSADATCCHMTPASPHGIPQNSL